jgi:cobalt-zinc-cadmium efflux system protein
MLHDHAAHPNVPSKEEALTYRNLYARVWFLTFIIVALEVTGSILSGSLALLADIGHIVTDSFLALIPLSVAHAIVKGSHERSRVPILIGGIVTSIFLLGIGAHVILEAEEALEGGHEHVVHGLLLFIFSLTAAGVNYTQHKLLSQVSEAHRHAAHSGYHFHVLTDLVKNIILPVLGASIALGILSEKSDLVIAYAIGIILMFRALLLLGETVWGHDKVTQVIDRLIQRLVH